MTCSASHMVMKDMSGLFFVVFFCDPNPTLIDGLRLSAYGWNNARPSIHIPLATRFMLSHLSPHFSLALHRSPNLFFTPTCITSRRPPRPPPTISRNTSSSSASSPLPSPSPLLRAQRGTLGSSRGGILISHFMVKEGSPAAFPINQWFYWLRLTPVTFALRVLGGGGVNTKLLTLLQICASSNFHLLLV